MNDILNITDDATLKHGMGEKKCAETCTKMRKNEQNLQPLHN